MTTVRLATFLLGSALALTPALAQQTPTCQHGASRMTVGGMDLDLMKCQLSTAFNTIGQQAAAISVLQAQVTMLQNDIAARDAEAKAKSKTPEPPKKP